MDTQMKPLHIPLSPWDHGINVLLTCVTQIFNPISIVIGLFMLLLTLFRIKYHRLSPDNSKKYQSEAVWSTEMSTNGKPSGFMFGKWFIGWMSESQHRGREPDRPSMTVLVLSSTHAKLCGTEDRSCFSHKFGPKSEKPTTFSNWGKSGNLFHIEYSSNQAGITTKKPRPFQKSIIERIIETYREKGTAAVFISGPPGCGKSSICDQLIRYLAGENTKCSFTDEFRPTEASDMFQSLYNEVDPSEDKPFIILIDEADGILRRLGGDGIPPHGKFLIQIKNKNEWNTFFDKVEKGRWKNVIFILTSNCSLDQIDDIDRSYTRPGRMDHRFEVSPDGSLKIQIPSENGLSWV